MTGISALPPQLQQRLMAELRPGEMIAWAGQPRPGRFMMKGFALWLFFVPWTAFALYWMGGAAGFRIPDFRNLMHWAPNITTDASGKANLDFYTSDQTGRYMVVIQGITPSGVSGSKIISFNVGKSSL